jgi:hypothetical protein
VQQLAPFFAWPSLEKLPAEGCQSSGVALHLPVNLKKKGATLCFFGFTKGGIAGLTREEN